MLSTTANKLTLLRIIMVPVYLVLVYFDLRIYAAAVFILASITDFLDGYIARHYNQVSNFGKFMDPLADKILVISAMCFFVECGQMPGWAVAIVLFREFAVSGLRLVAVEQGLVIAAAKAGKVKTACTMVFVIAMTLFPAAAPLNIIGTAVILVTTVYSGIEYFVRNKQVLAENK